MICVCSLVYTISINWAVVESVLSTQSPVYYGLEVPHILYVRISEADIAGIVLSYCCSGVFDPVCAAARECRLSMFLINYLFLGSSVPKCKILPQGDANSVFKVSPADVSLLCA